MADDFRAWHPCSARSRGCSRHRRAFEPWLHHGLGIADESADAGRAYFALESQTSVAVLRASPVAVSLDEAQSVLRKVVQMLSGTPASPRPTGRFHLRSPLEAAAGERTIALPSTVDVLDAWEDNRRLYGMLAALLAGRRLHGTYDDATVLRTLAADDRPPFLDDLFLVAETYRVAHRVAGEYAGVAAELAWACRRLLGVWERQTDPSPSVLFDAVVALALDPRGLDRPVAPWLAATAVVVCRRARAWPRRTRPSPIRGVATACRRRSRISCSRSITDAGPRHLPLMFDAGEGERAVAPPGVDDMGAPPVRQADRAGGLGSRAAGVAERQDLGDSSSSRRGSSAG